jgi:hypothetical protein
MDTIRAAQLEDVSHESDTRHLLDWVYYHGVLSRFAVHHWRHQSLIQSRSNARGGPHGDQYLQLSRYRPVCIRKCVSLYSSLTEVSIYRHFLPPTLPMPY